MITEKSNRLQVIVFTDYDYPISDWNFKGYFFCISMLSADNLTQ